jgi:hypothetical protein
MTRLPLGATRPSEVPPDALLPGECNAPLGASA